MIRPLKFSCFVFAAAALASRSRCRADAVSDQDQARLQVVTEFANNVLKDAADKTSYRPKPTPLLANGVNVYTKEHVKWYYLQPRPSL